jgi:hypothetical protein
MCIIAICETNTLPKEEFYECFKCMKDGFGFSWRDNDNVKFVKGIMKVDESWEIYEDFIKGDKNVFPHVLHFRLGSPVIPELTHPFIISENSELWLNAKKNKNNKVFDSVLFHNGIIPNWKDMLINTFIANGKIPAGEWSDTRMAAILVNKLGENVLDYLSGKYVMMTPTEIITSGDFITDDKLPGIRFSNKSYLVTRRVDNNWSRWPFKQQEEFKPKNYNNTLFTLNKTLEEVDVFIV